MGLASHLGEIPTGQRALACPNAGDLVELPSPLSSLTNSLIIRLACLGSTKALLSGVGWGEVTLIFSLRAPLGDFARSIGAR